jgi:hypothetical protein
VQETNTPGNKQKKLHKQESSQRMANEIDTSSQGLSFLPL